MMALSWLMCVYILCYITCAGGNIETKLSILKERVRVLETRLSEDISLIRKELYSEISSVKDSYGEVVKPAIAETLSTDFKQAYQTGNIEGIQLEINQLINQLGVLQQAFRVEKVFRRDLQNQIRAGVMERTDVVKNLADLEETVKMKIDEFDVGNITSVLEEIKLILEGMNSGCTDTQKKPIFNDCADLLRKGHQTSGIYEIYPDTLWRPLKVYCDMTTGGGGWTVFQRRCDGSENFYRSWNDYTYGFGNLSAEFWLGNEFIHRIMKQAPQELRIELEDFDSDRRFAHYGIFEITSAADLFKLHLEDFNGNVTDSLIASHNNIQFSTSDKGPSTSCANTYKGGFWYGNCHGVNINGEYLKGEHKSYANGVNWKAFRGYHYSLKFTEMKFRSK